MAAPKGFRPPGGSRLGKPNKMGVELREMILGALDKAGGVDYLVSQAHENPSAFLALVGKTLPKDIHATITNLPAEALTLDELFRIAGRGRTRSDPAAPGPSEPTKLH